MRRSDKLDREIAEKFSALTEETQAAVIETLIASLFGQAAVSFDRRTESGANP